MAAFDERRITDRTTRAYNNGSTVGIIIAAIAGLALAYMLLWAPNSSTDHTNPSGAVRPVSPTLPASPTAPAAIPR